MSSVNPCNKNNAVQAVAFVFQLVTPLDELALKKCIVSYQKDEELIFQLPRMQPMDSLTFQIGASQNQMSTPILGGVTFDKVKPNGQPEWALVVRREVIIVQCGDYTSWSEVWSKAKFYFTKIISILGDLNLQVQMVGLEFVDEFKVNNPQDPDWKTEIFNKQSKYVSQNIFDINGFWHSHHGFFMMEESGIKRRTLNILNIDYVEELGGECKVLVRSQIQSNFIDQQPNLNVEFMLNADLVICNNHDTNKLVMCDLLSNQMCHKVGLEGS